VVANTSASLARLLRRRTGTAESLPLTSTCPVDGFFLKPHAGSYGPCCFLPPRRQPGGAGQSGPAVLLCKPFPADGSPWGGPRGLVEPSPAVGDAARLVLGQGALPQPAAASAASDGAANPVARWRTEEVVLPAGWGFMTAVALSSCTLPSRAQAELVKPRAPTARPCMDEFTH